MLKINKLEYFKAIFHTLYNKVNAPLQFSNFFEPIKENKISRKLHGNFVKNCVITIVDSASFVNCLFASAPLGKN